MAAIEAVSAVTPAPPTTVKADAEPGTTTAADAAPHGRIRAAIKDEPVASTLTAVILLLGSALGGLLMYVISGLDDDIAQVDNRVAQLEAKTDTRFDKVDERFVTLETKMDARFEKVDERFVQLEANMDARFVQLEAKTDARFVALETKMDARFNRLEAEVKEINVGLTALIAHLNATEAVENAREFRIGDAPPAPETG